MSRPTPSYPRTPGGTRNREPGSPVRSFLKAAVLFSALAGVVFLARALELEAILEPSWADSHLRDGANGFSSGGVLLYLALTAALSPLGVPRQALSALGGYAFGAFFGTLFCSIGLVVGCSGGFFSSRLLARAALQQRFGDRIRRLDAFLARNPFTMTVAIRCFPAGNNALTNLAAGLTGIPALAFIGGSAVGYLPQTVIFALLGSGVRIDPVWRTSLSAALFILASLLGFALYHRFQGEGVLPLQEDRPSANSDERPGGSV